jgi:hypothetical protein
MSQKKMSGVITSTVEGVKAGVAMAFFPALVVGYDNKKTTATIILGIGGVIAAVPAGFLGGILV